MTTPKGSDKKFDVALVEQPGEKGLTLEDCKRLFERLAQDQAYPIEIMAKHVESSAMGFITRQGSKQLNFDYDCVSRAVSDILDDMALESPDGTYELCGLRISLERW